MGWKSDVWSVAKSRVGGDLFAGSVLFLCSLVIGGWDILWCPFLYGFPSFVRFFISILLYFKFMKMLLFVVSITVTFNILKITPQPPTKTPPKKSVLFYKSSPIPPVHPVLFLPQNHPNFHSSHVWYFQLDIFQPPLNWVNLKVRSGGRMLIRLNFWL